jgi:hypothetical protein
MKRPILVVAAMLVLATSAHAVGGIDLSVNACPGNPGAIGDVVPIDCASGASTVILGTWAPAVDIAGLVSLDGLLYLYVPAGLAQAGFWDFAEGCNSSALSTSKDRPGTGCAQPDYLDCWSPNGSGTAVATSYAGGDRGNFIAIVFTSYRPTLLSVSADQNLFGVQIVIDGRNAMEAGGSCAGCSQQVSLAWTEASPGSACCPTAHLSSPSGHYPGFGNCIGFSGLPHCSGWPVPTIKRTWGQLKSLYR